MSVSQNRWRFVAVVFLTASAVATGAAQSTQPAGMTIAIMDFDSKAPGNPEFGQQIAEILTIRLSLVDRATVVDRTRLAEILDEQKLKLRGLTDRQQAAEVGKLLGAQIMVFGKVFPVGDELYVTMKLIGVETGQLKGAIAKGRMTEDLSVILDRATNELVRQVETQAASLLSDSAVVPDPLAQLRERLSGRTLPTVAVVVPETHITRQIPDPAAETEVKRLLRELGFPVLVMDRSTLMDWAKDFEPNKRDWPSSLDKVDIVIVGEAFSERAGTYQGLISCSARLELNAVERTSAEMVSAVRATERAVDLSENIAAKTALQKCGHVAGMELATDLVKYVSGKSQ